MSGPLHQRLNAFVESYGFTAEDVPKVVGTFITMKYVTWAGAVAVGIRCHPLRRVLLSRSQALGEAGGGSNSMEALRPWAVMQRRWWLEACERARRHHPRRSFARAPEWQTAHVRARRFGARLGEALASARSQYSSAQSRVVRQVKGRWHSAGKTLLSQQQLQLLRLRERLSHHRGQAGSWHAWASMRYWQLSDRLETNFANCSLCQRVSRSLRVDLKGFVLGLAEGIILYKGTVWFTVPLQLWLVLQLHGHRRSALLLDDAHLSGVVATQSEEDAASAACEEHGAL